MPPTPHSTAILTALLALLNSPCAFVKREPLYPTNSVGRLGYAGSPYKQNAYPCTVDSRSSTRLSLRRYTSRRLPATGP
ncbi:hypothetical protein PF008_g7445 [Phytophthora fragariae]|uniref:Secreted protein n=1 Tax=Phytophthora fragariae TaxID=53985 RepID=A0A6G0S479_9STRA|nr:hypothetical protein PF008_g7445 [Phytophthora fragariae]